MKFKSFVICGIVGILCACSEQGNNQPDLAEENLSASELVEANAYIDVPEYVEGKIETFGSGSIFDNRMRAVLYRFIRHVKLENGKYVCDLTSGDDINVSPQVFDKLYREYVIEANQWIDEVHDRGNKAMVVEMGDDYLQHLLAGKMYRGELIEL